MAEHNGRVCIIGAGPSGLSALYHFNKLHKSGVNIPEVVCYEKQSDIGGQWNFSWKTGLDDHGEPEHSSMYHHLWSNGPKECIEYPDYTFKEHFNGKPVLSYAPRTVIYDYLKARHTKENIQRYISFDTIVRNVTYNKTRDIFTVTTSNLSTNHQLHTSTFSHVIVASGHFSYPNIPKFDGLEDFQGNVIHSHDFKDAKAFKGQRILIIGSSKSAEDLAMQCYKFGAEDIIISWRSKPMGFNWPDKIEERPLLTKVLKTTAYFKDGSQADVDSIILATGYLYKFPFLNSDDFCLNSDDLYLKSDDICLKTDLSLYPDNLYKGALWMKGGNQKLFYLGMQDNIYTFTMFDVQAEWVCRVIMGDMNLPPTNRMLENIKTWIDKLSTSETIKDKIDFQTEYVNDLCLETSRSESLDVSDMFQKKFTAKLKDIMTYRDQVLTSMFSNQTSQDIQKPWKESFDDSLEHALEGEF